ncbi:MAG: hypothetical protein IJK06_08455 [Clostridia bacterium]|nr:hypothetical protein [Clostridia bacterium]
MSELEKTIEFLKDMDDEQLQAIQVVARILLRNCGKRRDNQLKEEKE